MYICEDLSDEICEKEITKIYALYKDNVPNIRLLVIKSLFYINHFHKLKSIDEKIKKMISFLEFDEDYCINTFIKSIVN
jgi:hypothetical protein